MFKQIVQTLGCNAVFSAKPGRYQSVLESNTSAWCLSEITNNLSNTVEKKRENMSVKYVVEPFRVTAVLRQEPVLKV